MAKFIKLEDGSYVNAAAIHRIHLEKHTDPKFWKLNAQLSKPEGGAEWAYLAGEFGSLKEAEEAVRKLGKERVGPVAARVGVRRWPSA